jgi:hypothetical protein
MLDVLWRTKGLRILSSELTSNYGIEDNLACCKQIELAQSQNEVNHC